jgi:membrane protein
MPAFIKIKRSIFSHSTHHNNNDYDSLADLPATVRHELFIVAGANFLSQTGTGVMLISISVLALQLTQQVAAGPLVVATGALAPIAVVPLFNKLQNKVNVTRLMVVGDLGAFVVSVCLAILTTGNLISAWMLYPAMFLFSACLALYQPALREWGANSAGDSLIAFNGALVMATQLGVVIGWAVGGVFNALQQPSLAIVLCVILYGLAWPIQAATFHFRKSRKVVNKTQTRGKTYSWRSVFSHLAGRRYLVSLVSQALLQRLSFSMFVSLTAGTDSSRSWVPGVANSAFAAFSIAGAYMITKSRPAKLVDKHAPTILVVGICIQVVFGACANFPILAVGCFALIGLLSTAANVIQTDAQTSWKNTGAGSAFAVIGAIQAPIQAVGGAILSVVLLKIDVQYVYIAVVLIFGSISVVFAILARLAQKQTN